MNTHEEFGLCYSDTGEVAMCSGRAGAEADIAAINAIPSSPYTAHLVSRTVTEWAFPTQS